MVTFFSDLKRVSTLGAAKRVARQVVGNNILFLASELAYLFVLFLFPFLIFAVSLTGIVVKDPESTLTALTVRTQGFLPQEVIELLTAQLGRALRSTSSPTFISSVLFTLGVGSAAAESIIAAADRSYGVSETRPFWKRRTIGVLLIFGFTILIAAVVFMVLSPQTGIRLQTSLGLPAALTGVWSVASGALAFLALILALDILYYVAPNANLPFRWVTPGGFIAAALLFISNKILVFSATDIFQYTHLYGQMGVLIAALIWLYIAAVVVLVGIEVNAVLARMAEEQIESRIIEPKGPGEDNG